jgi:hypothetical protein
MRGIAATRTGWKVHESPHPTRCCMGGKWQQCERGRKAIQTTSVSLLHAREVVTMRKGLKRHKSHLRLAFAHEGGSSTNGVEKTSNPPPSRSCLQGRWWPRERGRRAVQTTSVSLLHAREVVTMLLKAHPKPFSDYRQYKVGQSFC